MIARFLIMLTLFAIIFSILLFLFLVGKRLLRKLTEELDIREDVDLSAKIAKLEAEKQKLASIRSEIEITSELARIQKEYESLNEQLRLLEIKKKVQSQKKRTM